MVQVLIFIGGAIVGYGLRKLTDVFNDIENSHESISNTSFSQSSSNETSKTQNRGSITSDLVDISSLVPIMNRYGIDPSSGNSIYILCNKIKTDTFKQLLDDIVEKTSNGEEFISFLDNVNIDTFEFPTTSSIVGKYFISKSSIDQLIIESGIQNCQLDTSKMIETLINIAYASAIERLKQNFGREISKILKAHGEHKELSSYYNDLINEVQISREFLNG